MRVAIIDGDTLLWVAAYYNRDEQSPDGVPASVDGMVTEILSNTKADVFCGFIKGNQETSHRHRMFPDYKANRPETPEWLKRWKPVIESYLIDTYGHWKFSFVNGMEVDDAVASVRHLVKQKGDIPIVCSVDKDFKQIPGELYNPRTKTITTITEDEAKHNLYLQILMGDRTDNIIGIPGIGPAKAAKILEKGKELEIVPHVTTLQAYCSAFGEEGVQQFAENVLKVTLKVDKKFEFKLNQVPQSIKQPIPTELFG